MTPPSPTPDLDQAAALHRAGRLTEASTLYQRVLAVEPNTPEALHGLALLSVDLGQPQRALPLLVHCLTLDPKNGAYRTSLGFALLRAGDAEQAAAQLVEAANQMPHAAEPRLYLARALGLLNRWSQAADVLTESVELFPGRTEIWAAKGNAERVLVRHADAERSLRKALELSPENPDVLNNLGVVVRAQGRTEEALVYYREALARAPDRAMIHANLGNALTQLGRGAIAEMHLRRAAELDPKNVEARSNFGAFLTKEERPQEAIPHFRAALEVEPRNVNAWTNLGVALLDTGETKEAKQCYRRAISLKSDNAEAHYNLAWALLLTGQWIEGWQEYEWRWKLRKFTSRKRAFAQPAWDGAPLPQGTILLHAEQGLGDAIQFVRYAQLVKARCANIIVECPRALVRLFEGISAIAKFISSGYTPKDETLPFILVIDRQVKANYVLEGEREFNSLILGSSRSYLVQAQRALKFGLNAFHFSCAGCKVEEFYCMLRFFLQTNRKPLKHIILGIDPIQFAPHLPLDFRLEQAPSLFSFLEEADRLGQSGIKLDKATYELSAQAITKFMRIRYNAWDLELVYDRKSGDVVTLFGRHVATMPKLRYSLDKSSGQWPKHMQMANELTHLHPRRLYYLNRLMQLTEEIGCKLTIHTNPLHPQIIAHFKEHTPYVDTQHALVEHIRAAGHRDVSVHSFLTPADFGGDDNDYFDGMHMGRENGDILVDYLMAKDL